VIDRLRSARQLFANQSHWELFRFVVALALPHRLGPIRLYLAAPFVVRLTERRGGQR
jgi:hypothetical protein